MKRLALLAAAIAVGVGCDPTEPRITELTARPESFCHFPQTIDVQWSAVANDVELSAAPAAATLSSEAVPGSGARDVVIDVDTEFTLSAELNSITTSRSESVGRLTGSRDYALGGAATCEGGRFVRTVSILPDEYSSEVVVRRIQNTGVREVTVQGPGFATTIPGLTAVPVPAGVPLVGTWTLAQAGPCREGAPGAVAGGEGPETALLGVATEVGCPSS